MIYKFFTGSYGQRGEDGIAVYFLDTAKKTLTRKYGFSEIPNPSWVLTNAEQTRLYAVQEQVPEGMVHELSIGREGLRLVRSFPSGGADPCHLSLDAAETFLFCANYTSGSFAAFALDRGGKMERTALLDQHEGKGVNPDRQECAHVHFSREHDGLVYVCDLGLDRVFVYGKDKNGQIRDTGARLIVPDGLGPRHLEFDERHPELIYLLCELGNCIAVYRKGNDSYDLLQLISTLPEGYEGKSTASSIRRSGDLIFAANRGHDSIAVFEIQDDGTLVQTAVVPCCGKTPRDMQPVGEYLIIANQDSDQLVVLQTDLADRTLTDTGIRANIVRPSCICPLN